MENHKAKDKATSTTQKKRGRASEKPVSGSSSTRIVKTKHLTKTGLYISNKYRGRTLTTKVTIKGQVTVPKPVREHLNLAKGDRIEFLIGVDGKVTIVAATEDVRRLKGIVSKPAKPVTVEDMNQAVEVEGGTLK
jgi:antitoxin PrlF